MRTCCLVFVVAACGRIGFDPPGKRGGPDGGSNPDDGGSGSGGDGPSMVGCPTTYKQVGSLANRYRLASATATFDEGSALCTSEGTRMVILDDAAENNAMLVEATTQGGGIMWAGVIGNGTTFVTVEGVVATYLPWASGSPSAPTTTTAVGMRQLNPEAGRLVTIGSGTSGVNTYCECMP